MKRVTTHLARALAVGAFAALLAAPAAASADNAMPAETPCSLMAGTLLEGNGMEPEQVSYDYLCTPGVVSVEVAAADGTVSTFSEETEELASSLASDSAVQARAVTCSIFGTPTRTIVSELQVNVDFCVGYGQNNHPQNGSWLRSAKVE